MCFTSIKRISSAITTSLSSTFPAPPPTNCAATFIRSLVFLRTSTCPPTRQRQVCSSPSDRLTRPQPPSCDRIYKHRCFTTLRPQRTKLQAVLGEADEMDAYNFPDARLKKKLDDPAKTPLLLVACGSFSPITFLHLRMFVMADDYVKHNTNFEVIGGYLSPVSDAYRKQGLAPAEHRYAASRSLHHSC